MATLAVGRRVIVGAPREAMGGLEKVRNIFAAISSFAGPYLAAGRLDYLEPESRANLTHHERSMIDVDLNSLHTN